jgi:hypothetical protein
MELNRKVGSLEYDKLIAGTTPPVKVTAGIIRKLSASATYARGTALAKSSVDNKLVILGTEAEEAVDAVAPTYALTEDVAVSAGKSTTHARARQARMCILLWPSPAWTT